MSASGALRLQVGHHVCPPFTWVLVIEILVLTLAQGKHVTHQATLPAHGFFFFLKQGLTLAQAGLEFPM